MTQSERERKIEAVAREVAEVWPSMVTPMDSLVLSLAERFVDAADEAVPSVSEEEAKAKAWAWVSECIEDAQRRADRAETAASEFAEELRNIVDLRPGKRQARRWVTEVLSRHPSFLGEKESA